MVDAVACTNYLGRIALTNQYPSAIAALEPFVTMLNQVTTNNMSASAFASLYWSLQNDRGVTLTGDFENDMVGCLNQINTISAEKHLFLSILDISCESLFGKSWLMAGLRIRQKNNPAETLGDVPIVYREGEWHFIPGYEQP